MTCAADFVCEGAKAAMIFWGGVARSNSKDGITKFPSGRLRWNPTLRKVREGWGTRTCRSDLTRSCRILNKRLAFPKCRIFVDKPEGEEVGSEGLVCRV